MALKTRTSSMILLTLLVTLASGCSGEPADLRYSQTVLGKGRLLAIASSGNSVWAVGSNGLVISCSGDRWKTHKRVTMNNLTGVSCLDPSHVWASGEKGTVLYYDGDDWTMQQLPESSDLCGIFALDGEHVWTVGTGGIVYFFDGHGWTKQDSGVKWNIRGVSASDRSHVWAVGAGGILFNDGSAWSPQWRGNGAFQGMCSVTAVTDNQVFAGGSVDGGEYPLVMYFDGRTWERIYKGRKKDARPKPVRSLTVSGSNVYAVRNNVFLRFNGSTWSEETATDGELLTVTSNRGTVWAAGYRMEADNIGGLETPRAIVVTRK